MEALYNRTLRIILGVSKATSGKKLLQILNIPNLRDRIKETKNNHEYKRDKIMIMIIDQFKINQ